MFDYDLFVIGAGSGGVRAARIAATHGAKVAVAEEYRVGGTCVLRGCVPKKLLIFGAEFADELTHAERFGWQLGERTFSWPKLRDYVQAEVTRLEGLYRENLERHHVEIVPERAKLRGPQEIELASGRIVTAKYVLVATGARPHVPAVPGCELGLTSNEMFTLEKLPEHAVIVGGGYIANEFAGLLHQLGSRVTLVNRTDTILRHYDRELRERLLELARARGMEFRFEAELERIERRVDGALDVHAGAMPPLAADLVLLATGRQPNSEDLGLEQAGVEIDERGAIRVDENSRSSCESVYAVGDVTDRLQLTPVAIREGHAFADTVFGHKPWRMDYRCVPNAVFSHPPIAAVGLTEAEAREQFGDCKVYRADFRPMKHAFAGLEARALYKMVCHPETEQVLGLHMLGPEAPELLQVAAVAVKAGLTKRAFDETVALHPTMAEELVLLR